MKTLVTGATGLLGNNVVRLLLGRGDAVRVLVRESSDPRPLEGLNVERCFGDVRDADAVRQAIEGVDRVIHSAALVQVGWTEVERTREINVGGTRHVASAARAAKARMVHVSSCDAVGVGAPQQPADEETTRYANVSTPYVVTKQEAEQVVQEEVQRGLSASIVNPGFMLGPWDWKPSSGQMLLEVGGGRGWIAPRGWTSVCDARDVAAATIAALEHGAQGRRYILAGENMTYLELWRRIAEVTGARRPLFSLGPVNAAIVGAAGDLWTRLSGNEPVFNSAAIKMAKVPKIYSSARAVQELGYHNRPLQESIADGWQWFREQGYLRREA